MKTQGIEITLSCQTLEVSRSGYYTWQPDIESHRERSNRLLLLEIQRIYQESRETYGSPRITAQLKAEGISCSKNRIAKLMRQAGMAGIATKRFKVRTTDSNHDLPIASRVFQTENPKTLPTRPNQVWASDITYIPTEEGWLYLAIYLDIFTRKVVGSAMEDHMKTELILKALRQAILMQRLTKNGLINHSDQGSQYSSKEYRQLLNLLGITASMSRRGNCYDNAYAESFFHTLKVELIHRRRFKTRREAMTAIFEYIETWYNRKRLHSSLGYLSPIDYEKAHSSL